MLYSVDGSILSRRNCIEAMLELIEGDASPLINMIDAFWGKLFSLVWEGCDDKTPAKAENGAVGVSGNRA